MPGAPALKRPRQAAASPPPPASRARRRTALAAAPPPAAAAAAVAPHSLPPYRLEFSATDPPSAALAAFLARHRHRLGGVHVANKDKGDLLLERGAALARALATATEETTTAATTTPHLPTTTTTATAATTTADDHCACCLHYSLKLQGRGDDAVRRLAAFLAAAARQRCSVLLVSGGGKPEARPKGQLSTVEALERLAALYKQERAAGAGPGAEAAAAAGAKAAAGMRARGTAAAAAGGADDASPPLLLLPPIYVAFNPYFPQAQDRKAERDRLRAKLATGLVSGGVALQFGDDAALLDEALSFLRRADVLGATGRILGSVFVPTKRFLAQMRFRPWHGVFLGGGGRAEGEKVGYLSSVEAAERATAVLLRVYRAHGATPLVETAVADDEALGRAEALLMRGMESEEEAE